MGRSECALPVASRVDETPDKAGTHTSSIQRDFGYQHICLHAGSSAKCCFLTSLVIECIVVLWGVQDDMQDPGLPDFEMKSRHFGQLRRGHLRAREETVGQATTLLASAQRQVLLWLTMMKTSVAGPGK